MGSFTQSPGFVAVAGVVVFACGAFFGSGWSWWKVYDLKEHLAIRQKHINRLLGQNADLRDALDGRKRGTCEPVEELKTYD